MKQVWSKKGNLSRSSFFFSCLRSPQTGKRIFIYWLCKRKYHPSARKQRTWLMRWKWRVITPRRTVKSKCTRSDIVWCDRSFAVEFISCDSGRDTGRFFAGEPWPSPSPPSVRGVPATGRAQMPWHLRAETRDRLRAAVDGFVDAPGFQFKMLHVKYPTWNVPAESAVSSRMAERAGLNQWKR